MAPHDYSKKKNAELEELLKARNLPHTGKKAELVARLQQSDAESTAPAAAPDAAGAEDEIDWDEPPPTDAPAATNPADATTEPAAASLAAGGAGQAPNPEAVPNQVKGEDTDVVGGTTVVQPGEDSEATHTATVLAAEDNAEAAGSGAGAAAVVDTGVAGAGTGAETGAETGAGMETGGGAEAQAEEKPKPDFTAHLASSSVEAELEKRKRRAARFGIPDTDSGESTKALERAKRFGTGASADDTESKDGGKSEVKGLDMALPERERKRGRGGEQPGREGKRRDSRDSRRREDRGPVEGRGRRFGGAGGGGGGKGNKEQMDRDRAAAEARKKRFAAGS